MAVGSILLLEDASQPAPPKPKFALGIDVSNYSGTFSAARLQQYWDCGIRLVIIQAFPQGYAQYAIQKQQMESCVEFGMPFECYIYDYLSSPSWRTDALVGLSTIVWQPPRVWADEEDTTANGVLHSVNSRIAAVNATLVAIANAGYDTGIYTGAWWWKGYLGNTTQFSNYLLWDSHYDLEPDPDFNFVPYGGWTQCEIKQYAGSQPDGTDLNVFRVH